jgi:Ser/Thr protein kinase RdoA (MazF antagonist)
MSSPAETVTSDELHELAGRFAIDGAPERIEAHGAGHINDTYFVTTTRSRRYVLQRINADVFVDPVAVIENTARVTAHVEAHVPGLVPPFVRAQDGAAAVRTRHGAWRMTGCVAGGEIGCAPLDLARSREAGAAFGRFQAALRDYPIGAHRVPIPGFLELTPQLEALDAALADAANAAERRTRAARAVAAVSARRDADALARRGPEGVIHADCKVSNVLFAVNEPRVLAVIDLDTVMVGPRAWDFGDLVRSAAARGGEDEAGLALDLDRFEALARGFVAGLGDLFAEDLRVALAQAPRYITLTLAVRFLVDYLRGDRYFRVDDPTHNLRRAEAQLALVTSLEQHRHVLERVLRQI